MPSAPAAPAEPSSGRSEHRGAPPLSGVMEPGERLGPFVIRSCLGRGGMGVVYRAEDERMRREVALKVLRADAAPDPELERRLVREARAAGSMTHPNIAVMFEVGEADGRHFVAMELIEGQSLAERIERGPLPLGEAIGVALQILDGLGAAHAAGFIHRDLKPANVMLTARGVVKVLDFGIATRLWAAPGGLASESTLTADGRVIGTPAYMAPEQARGHVVDQRTDLFAFGVILFEMLSGQRPFGGPSVADITTAVLRDAPIPLASLRPETPPAICRVVERCLEKDPSARYPLCAEVRADLERAWHDSAAASAPVAPVDTPSAPPPLALPAVPSRRAWPWLAGAGALALAVALAILLLRAGPDDEAGSRAASAAPASAGSAITERPPPRSDKPEALAAYAAALQSFRDANWSRAATHLERAVALDPGLAAAHLRLAVIRGAHQGSREARASYASATEARAALDALDRAMLDALEPLVGRGQPDAAAAAARWRELAAAFPDDAEAAALAAFFANDSLQVLALARRATAIDPQYADAWQLQARALSDLGRIDEIAEPLDRCTAIAPTADDCRMERAFLAGTQGDCALMEEHLRVMVARSSQTYPYVLSERASALYAMGRPDETVLEALAQLWARREPAQRAAGELADRALLDIARGRFAEAERRLVESGQLVAPDAPADQRVERVVWLALLYQEMGRPDDAARVAQDYFSRRDAWMGVSLPDKEAMLLRVLLHSGRLSAAAFTAERQALLARTASISRPRERWNVEHLVGLASAQEAEAARAARDRLSAADAAVLENRVPANAFMGRFHLLSGAPERAAAVLEKATGGCWELRYALVYNPARLDLGSALAATGDRRGACAAYADILARWGAASPRSLTAEEARRRAQLLGCE